MKRYTQFGPTVLSSPERAKSQFADAFMIVWRWIGYPPPFQLFNYNTPNPMEKARIDSADLANLTIWLRYQFLVFPWGLGCCS
jgi:hypothetical protein